MRRARGLALHEVIAAVAFCAAMIPPVMTSWNAKKEAALRARDQQQIGKIMRAFDGFASVNNGHYPLPSELDLNNTTVPRTGAPQNKNNTGNIMSILIFNGLLTPEQLVSPAESAVASVVVDHGYEYSKPSRAVVPADALWDPGFAGTPLDFTSRRRAFNTSNQSYTHILPFGRRASQWRPNTATLRPIIANRGPTYAPNDSAPYPTATNGRWELMNNALGVHSNTLLIHGRPRTWEGLVAFSDLHVEFWETPSSRHVSYPRTGIFPLRGADNLFVNESDEVGGDPAGRITNGTNAYMRPVANVVGTAANPSVTLWRD